VGHNIHFLERIERLNLRQADRALGLYRDPQAVAFLLQRFHLPDGVERVALALGGGEQPPHVVLTRSGQFVTCLGAGMATRDLHAVPFVQMERELNHLGALRETLNGKVTHGAAREKLKNLFHKSDGISREEFSSLMTLRPLLGEDLLSLNASSWDDVDSFRKSWHPHPKLRGSSVEAHTLSLYWRALWAASHITSLLAVDVPELEHFFGRVANGAHGGLTLTWSPVRSGVLGLILRGWHTAAQLGRTFLPVGRYVLNRGMVTEHSTLLTVGGLLAVRARHPELSEAVNRLIDEAEQSLELRPDNDGEESEGAQESEGTQENEGAQQNEEAASRVDPALQQRLRQRLGNPLRTIIRELKRPSDQPSTAFLPAVREGLMQAFPPGIFDRPEDVPDDIAICMSLYQRSSNTYESFAPTINLAQCLPHVARLEPQQLYLPEHLMRYVVHPTNKVDIDAVREHLDFLKPRVPHVAKPKPGRNTPCPCGSGKKYKACCGK
jgi:hypothetical protein